MAILTYILAGLGFILIGTCEALMSTFQCSSIPRSTQINHIETKQNRSSIQNASSSFSSSVSFLIATILSIFFIINSIFSFADALDVKDRVGSALQLEIISVASMFLLYGVVSLVADLSNFLPRSYSLRNLLILFGFLEEFLLFYLQRKNPSGIENRYFDLLLVPIAVCIVSSILELRSRNSIYPRLIRGIGLISQGTWFVQMGISFFTSMMAHGCSLLKKSRGNFTVKCKGHPEYHRGRAIATLLFNLHLALLVVMVVGAYAVICRKREVQGELRYKPIGAEMQQQVQYQGRSGLDSGDDNDGFREDGDTMKHDIVVVSEQGSNGYTSHY